MKTDFNRFEPVWTGWFQFVLVGLSWNKFPACRFEIIFTLLYILKLRSSKFTWFLCPFDDLLSAAKLVNCISLCKLHLYPIRYDYFGWLLRTRDDVTSNTPFFRDTRLLSSKTPWTEFWRGMSQNWSVCDVLQYSRHFPNWIWAIDMRPVDWIFSWSIEAINYQPIHV